MEEYLGVLISFLIAGLVAGGFLLLSSLLGPKRPTVSKQEPFECGLAPFQLPAGRMPVKFYLVGMLFLLFDVELVFLFPWAVVFRQLGLFGFIEMLVFLGVVLTAFVYAWKKGALDWD